MLVYKESEDTNRKLNTLLSNFSKFSRHFIDINAVMMQGTVLTGSLQAGYPYTEDFFKVPHQGAGWELNTPLIRDNRIHII